MYAVLKNTLLVGSAAALFSVITFSGSKTGRLLPEQQGKEAINPFMKVMPSDTPPPEEQTPPVTNDDLHYPIKENGYDEPVYNAGNPLQLNNPSNIKTTTEYNPADSSYTFKQKMGDLDYRTPTYMTQEEYQDYKFKQLVKSYWKSRIQADSKSDPKKKQLIPTLKVNSELFDRLFGGNNVDIRPTGSAELDLGVITNRNQNPAIPVKQRKISNFNFNMKIQMNLVANIGTKLKLTMNYNTEASFDFENQVKIQWAGDENDILKKVEAGNVSLPLNSALIQGSQTLFGVKATMQFGKLTVAALAAQQRGKKTELNIQNGAQTQTYTVQADNYEANRHYFLGQWFRDNYSQWLSNAPIISSPVQITKIEVWVTNKTAQFDQARNVAGFSDLAEEVSHVYQPNTNTGNPLFTIQDSSSNVSKNPRNTITNLYKMLVDSTNPETPLYSRDYNTAVSRLNAIQGTNGNVFNAGREFEVLTRARRLNPATDYYLNNRLGYISLNTALNYDEVLMVSYQYTLNGKVYQVGEFSDQFPSTNQLLVMKLLKSTQVILQIPMWDLMMKNVYSIGAYSLSQTNFMLQVYYNNIKTGVDIPYVPYGSMDGHLLIQKMGLDRINQNQDAYPDGNFDFIPNVTVNPQNGRIYFTHPEPFGSDLLKAFTPDEQTNHYNDIQNYIFQELYDSTKVSAQQLPNKDRYKLKGSYQSATSNEFSLNSMNIPQGSVKVTAGGVPLTENVDYTVDYNLGRVKIINESVLNSGQAIKITAENNSLFNVQQKSMYGARFDYKHSKNLTLGGTILHYGERPLTQKVNIGDEPVSNTMLGIDGNYTANAPWLTRLIDKIPLIQTKEPSSINLSGEAADLIAGHASAISSNGGTSYIDDFEGSVSTIDLRSATAWFHSSIPENQPFLFPETATSANANDSLRWGKNRAKLAWYNIDQSVFYQQSSGVTPSQVTTVVQSNHFMEPFFEQDLFPKKTPPNNQPQLLPMLDLAYYPEERGPYNFDVKPTLFSAGVDVAKSNDAGHIVLKKPETRWAGIMRSLTTNDFQASNIEYIQFWMMDPFNEDYNNQSQSQYNTFHQAPPTNGELYFNLGNISEDILKDGAMSYENGIPPNANDTNLMQKSVWGRTPVSPPLVNAFDVNESSRPIQDVGYDCYKDADEQAFYKLGYTNLLSAYGVTSSTAFSDPAGDNYHFYRGDDYDNLPSTSDFVANTLFRYKEYNNVEGNSPTPSMYQSKNSSGYSTVGTTSPNIEDVNKDNTLNQAESYYQYKIKVTPQDINENNVGNNYIVNVVPVTKAGPDGIQRTVNFYQFKIPITNYEDKIGTISGYNSIRFMRMFVKSFSGPVVMRFARLELVRSDWRNYQEDLSTPTGGLITNQQTTFVSSGISYQENGTRTPIDYVIPPGINQQQNVQTTNLVLMNEQSISMQVDNLKDGDARAIYKNISNDFRSYKKIRMFVHAEKLANKPLNDGDMRLFVRIGSDFTNNYYDYEVPLKLTAPGSYDNNNDDDKKKVWPSDNEVIINLEEIENLKLLRNQSNGSISTAAFYTVTTSETGVAHTIGVVGNPNMGAVTSVMIGVMNPLTPTAPKALSAEVWVDELRVTDFNQHGGQAVIGRVTAKLADFGQLAFSGQYATPWFGSIDAKPTDRSRNTTQQYNVNGTFQLGKFLPKDWKVNLPFYFQQGVTNNVPLFDPTNGDIYMSQINSKSFTNDEIKTIKDRAIDHTLQQGYNFTNVSKQRGKNKTKSFPWDIENFSLTYAYTRIFKSNVNLDHSENRTYNGLLSYNYQMQLKAIEPFKKSTSKLMQSPWLAILKEMSIKPLPTQFQFSDNVTRTYLESKARDISSESGSNPLLTQTQYNKTFNTTRNYSTKWDLTKNIKLDYTAVNIGRVLELHDTGRNVTSEEKNLAAKNLIIKGGTNTSYQQTTNANILLPLNKIPALDFITQASVKYSGNYQWLRRPFAVDTVGNTIQNTQTQGYTAQLNMVNLYNKIPYFKRLNQNLPKPKKDDKKKDDKKKDDKKGKNGKNPKDPKSMIPGKEQSPDNKQVNGNNGQQQPDTTKKKDSNPLEIFDHLARIIMTVKQIQGSYNITQGTTLPGFEPTSGVLGMSNNGGSVGAPGFGFVFGGNQGKMPNFNDGLDDALHPKTGVVYDAEKHHWLVQRQNFSTQYLHTKTQTLTYNANVEPLKNLKITLSGNMTHAQTESYFIGYDPSNPENAQNNGYQHYTPVFGGTYNVSIISIGTAFSTTLKDGSYDNSNFDRYLKLRQQYSQQLANGNPNSTKSFENGYYDGYNLNQQDVVINSFIRAYTTHSDKASKVSKNPFSRMPLPGWNVTYDGLGKIPAAKKLFKSIVLTHGYHSTMSYGNYTNNQAFHADSNGYAKARAVSDSTGTTGNFVSQYLINSVNITESFSPLIKVNVMFVDKGKMKGLGANFEIKRDRSMSLASNVPQIMEMNSSEYNIGLNYTLPQLEIKKLQIKGKPLKSDLMATVTVSFRKTQTILRQAVDQIVGNNDIATQLNQVSNGQNITTIKVSLSYALTQNINLRIYYDRTINKPVISTSFPTSVTNAGVSLRFAIQ